MLFFTKRHSDRKRKLHPTFIVCILLALSTTASSAPQKEVRMISITELENRVNQAQPGETIILPDGIYEGEEANLIGKGTFDKPIILRAASRGKTIFKSPIQIEGQYLTLEGFAFEAKGNIEIEGTGIRITRCTMTDVQVGKWIRVRPDSRQVEIDHCRFANKTNNLVEPRGCQLMQIVVRNQGEKHHIHHNYFLDIPKGKSSNGYETVQLITQGNPFDPDPGDCGTIIENNLFERCNGEAEVISVKSNGNILRANTFKNCRGGLVLRHGDGNTVSECFFIGDDEPRAGGVRLQGQDQVVINNSFKSLGAYGVAMMDGTPDDLYIRTERALVAFNTFVDCDPALNVGLNHSKHPNGTPPKDSTIANNLFVTNTSGQTVRFVQNDEPENWTWQGNVTNGDLGISERDGILKTDITLQILPNGIPLPPENFLKTAQGNFPNITTDAMGQPRGEQKTIGCIEHANTPKSGGPLLHEHVGPDAK